MEIQPQTAAQIICMSNGLFQAKVNEHSSNLVKYYPEEDKLLDF